MTSTAARLREHVGVRGGPTLQNGVWQLMLDAADEMDAIQRKLDDAEDARDRAHSVLLSLRVELRRLLSLVDGATSEAPPTATR